MEEIKNCAAMSMAFKEAFFTSIHSAARQEENFNLLVGNLFNLCHSNSINNMVQTSKQKCEKTIGIFNDLTSEALVLR